MINKRWSKMIILDVPFKENDILVNRIESSSIDLLNDAFEALEKNYDTPIEIDFE